MQENNHSKKSYSENYLEDESISLLEWDSLKTHLASFASTEMGKRSILNFEIPLEYEVASTFLNETVEITDLENSLDHFEYLQLLFYFQNEKQSAVLQLYS